MTGQDLNDTLEDLFAPGAPVQQRPQPPAHYVDPVERIERTYTEGCGKCGGSGQFRGYSGRVFGQCFACKGKGSKTFKSSHADRVKNREQAADRKVRKSEDAVEAFKTEHPAEHAWVIAKAGSFDFAAKMLDAVRRWGSLTPGQLAAVSKCVARDAERAAQRKLANDLAPQVDVSKLEAAFARARGDAARDGEGVRWLKLRLDTFIFSDAPANGQWPAAIFVKEGVTKIGRIVGGRYIAAPCTSEETKARVITACADPAAAAKAYGLRFGSCSICGRELTNAESRERGIGPICAERFGF